MFNVMLPLAFKDFFFLLQCFEESNVSLFFFLSVSCIPCDFEDPKQPNTPQHRNAKRRHDLHLHQHGLQNSSTHHKTVKTIEEGYKVGLRPQTVHLQQHLNREKRQKHLVGNFYKRTGKEQMGKRHFI